MIDVRFRPLPGTAVDIAGYARCDDRIDEVSR